MFLEYSSENMVSKKYRYLLVEELSASQEALIPMQIFNSR
jgi:hypothetical protein